jgi:hypothetical protein
MKRSAAVVAAALALLLCGVGVGNSAFAKPSQARGPVAPPQIEAHASGSIPQFLKNLARRWMRSPSRRIVMGVAKYKIKRSARKYLSSGGTECEFPFPKRFCSKQRRQASWGLGQAVWYYGRPGVWNRKYSRQYEVSAPLVPGRVYWLTCWRPGDRVNGPYGSTDLWYRVPSGGYVSDALLYTGTNNVIPGVDRC